MTSDVFSLSSVSTHFMPPSSEELEALEAIIQRQLSQPKSDILKLLGYGEVTLAIAHPREKPVWACKRLPPIRDIKRLERYKRHVEIYIAELGSVGVSVLPTSCHIVPSRHGQSVLILSQPIVPENQLGVAVLNGRKPFPDDSFLSAIFTAIKNATSLRIGLDAQLANWAFIDGQAYQIDVSTPFTCDVRGKPELDDRLMVLPFPWPMRAPLRWWVVPSVLKRYHGRRQTFIDFIANLYKEGLQNWVAPSLIAANRIVEIPISQEEVLKYYQDDAALWEFIYQSKRFSRATTQLFGGTYQFLLPPPTRR
jgi:Family of unknown function (DUF6206)